MQDTFRCHKYQETIAFDTEDIKRADDGIHCYAPARGIRTGAHYTVRFRMGAFTGGCGIEDVQLCTGK